MILLLYSISLFIIRLDKKPVNRGGKTALSGGGFKRHFRVGRLQMKRPKCSSAHPGEGRGEEGICVLRNGGVFSVIGRPHGERARTPFSYMVGRRARRPRKDGIVWQQLFALSQNERTFAARRAKRPSGAADCWGKRRRGEKGLSPLQREAISYKPLSGRGRGSLRPLFLNGVGGQAWPAPVLFIEPLCPRLRAEIQHGGGVLPGQLEKIAADALPPVLWEGQRFCDGCRLTEATSHQRQAVPWKRQGLTAPPFFEWRRRADSAGTRSFHRTPLPPAVRRNTAWWGCAPGPAGEDGCQRPAAGTAGGPATL